MVNDKLSRERDPTGTKSTNMHTIPAKSNHNTDKHPTQRHVKPKTTKTTKDSTNITNNHTDNTLAYYLSVPKGELLLFCLTNIN